MMTPADVTERVAQECIDAGVKQIWMYRALGAGAVNADAVHKCREHGIDVIAGECPFMFLPHTGFIHRVHGFLRRIGGSLPA